MDDEENEDREAKTRRILNEARATLARLKRHTEVESAKREIEEMPPTDVANTLLPSPPSRNERWRMEAKAFEAAREAARAEIASASPAQSFDWSALDQRVRTMIESECMYLVESCGKALGEILLREREETAARIQDEVRELRIEIAKLGSENAALREMIAHERSRTAGVDPLPRRVN
jgi:hypothetical protein